MRFERARHCCLVEDLVCGAVACTVLDIVQSRCSFVEPPRARRVCVLWVHVQFGVVLIKVPQHLMTHSGMPSAAQRRCSLGREYVVSRST